MVRDEAHGHDHHPPDPLPPELDDHLISGRPEPPDRTAPALVTEAVRRRLPEPLQQGPDRPLHLPYIGIALFDEPHREAVSAEQQDLRPEPPEPLLDDIREGIYVEGMIVPGADEPRLQSVSLDRLVEPLLCRSCGRLRVLGIEAQPHDPPGALLPSPPDRIGDERMPVPHTHIDPEVAGLLQGLFKGIGLSRGDPQDGRGTAYQGVCLPRPRGPQRGDQPCEGPLHEGRTEGDYLPVREEIKQEGPDSLKAVRPSEVEQYDARPHHVGNYIITESPAARSRPRSSPAS